MHLLPNDISVLEQLEKSAEGDVEAPKQEWAEKVLGKLYATHPFFHPYKVTITYKHVKPEDEYASGTIAATRDGTAWVYVPFVIEAGELKPLDIMSDGKRYHYLTEERVRVKLDHPTSDFAPAGKTPSSGANPDSSSDELNTYRDADTFLSKVSSRLSSSNLVNRLHDLSTADPRWVPVFAEKKASLTAADHETEVLAVQASNDGDYYTISVLNSDGSIEKESAIHAEVLSKLGAVPQTRLTAPVNARFAFDEPPVEIEKLSTEGLNACEVYTDEGFLPVMIFSDVFSLEGQKLANKAAVGNDFNIYGPLFGRSINYIPKIASFAPARGRGMFVFEGGVTEPITIKASYIDAGSEKLSFHDELGLQGTIVYGDVIIPQRVRDDLVMIPKSAKFIPVGEEKKACAPEVADPDTFLNSYGATLHLSGNTKTAEVSDDEMELILVGLGCPANRAERIIKRAHVVGTVPAPALGSFDGAKKVAFMEIPELTSAVLDLHGILMTKSEEELLTIKEATGLLPTDSVDAVLGLNLSSEELLGEARAVVPTLEKTQDSLAELLLLSRLGVLLRGKDTVILKVIKGLDNLMGNLRTLEAGL